MYKTTRTKELMEILTSITIIIFCFSGGLYTVIALLEDDRLGMILGLVSLIFAYVIDIDRKMKNLLTELRK